MTIIRILFTHLKEHDDSMEVIAAVENKLVNDGYDNIVRVWNFMERKCIVCLQGHINAINYVAINNKFKRCTSSSLDGISKFWSLDNGENLWRLENHSSSFGVYLILMIIVVNIY
ncbi:12219_t:CDS:1 [Entrophospora sp. SA101]|nr:12179_t:CDS:1 [Entrophospora sp. SA101]CAJ0883610.1 12219_t:CDS:1 [Entrophospora sp. SA101]